MQRIANGSQAASLPVPAAISGTPGYFTDGSPATGIQGTILDNDWLNRVQEGLIGDGQFLRLSASGNITVPAWATRARARLWGAGGGAGSSANNSSAGGGGGGGGYLEVLISGLVGGAVIACAVGGGGTAGTGANAGGAGGPTSLGGYASCTGGTGGGYASGSASTSPGTGGGPTTATGVQVIDLYNGLSGGQGYPNGSVGIVGAPGGSSFASGYVPPPTSDTTTPKIGFGGGFAGQGGASGVNGGTGGSGANGLILIEWLP